MVGSEAEFAAWTDGLGEEDLVALLAESHPVYQGRGEQAATRMRGYVLTRLARLERLEEGVLPSLYEELETGFHPYPLAAAARALARVRPIPLDWAPLVEAALRRVQAGDDALQLDAYPLDDRPPDTSATAELRRTARLLAGGAGGTIRLGTTADFRRPATFDAEMEDHLGRRTTFREFFVGRPSFVTFFYTRCNNPAKCSANVRRWGELARALDARGLGGRVRTAAVTYDPAYDRPERLRAYAEDRDVPLGDDHRVLRVPEDFLAFRRAFALNVGYSETTVNRHASEAFVLGARGETALAIARAQWTVEEALAALAALA